MSRARIQAVARAMANTAKVFAQIRRGDAKAAKFFAILAVRAARVAYPVTLA